ncbi:MAG: glycosyltransferase family 4 protein [Microbispora sp.]|nr:glycosyltransferase family 4 protein [Microbispora sp.]
MTPRVLVDAAAVPADRGALIRYVDGLVAALHEAGADLALVCQRADAERYAALAPSARILSGPPAITNRDKRLAWEQTGLPVLARQAGAQVIHAPYYSIPLGAGLPTVVTIHDVTSFTDPDLHDPVRASFFRSATRTAVRHANRVIVPSKATMDELVRVLDADPTRIDVAYHGVDPALFHPPAPEDVRRVAGRIGLHGRPYVAYLGALEPRKNVPNLVTGFGRAVGHLSSPPALVLAGGPAWDEEVDAAIAALPPQVKVVRPGYLPFADLPGFLGGALVVASPSRCEGFGLPVLEAMACGAPVLTTHRASLPEVGGDAVAYTEPDADSIARALRALLESPERRERLAAAGVTRSKEFTWRHSAEAHLVAYQRAIED